MLLLVTSENELVTRSQTDTKQYLAYIQGDRPKKKKFKNLHFFTLIGVLKK